MGIFYLNAHYGKASLEHHSRGLDLAGIHGKKKEKSREKNC